MKTCFSLCYGQLSVACLVLLLFSCTSPQENTFIAGGRTVDISVFDSEMQQMMDQVGVPAASVAIIENGEIAYTRSYGLKELGSVSKVGGETVFEGASLSKTFLVYVVHKLADESKIDLDMPLYKYLPYEGLQHDERYQLITPRMVLSHTSGIENWKWFGDPEVLEIVKQPGEAYVYSGEGFNYLAKVVEKILGVSYFEYVTSMVLEEFQLQNTYLKYTAGTEEAEGTPSDYAIGYNPVGKPYNKWKNEFTSSASGIHFTANDYAQLILGMFERDNLSKVRSKSIVQPVLNLMGTEDFSAAMGTGFL